jgi:hypothetical protein
MESGKIFVCGSNDLGFGLLGIQDHSAELVIEFEKLDQNTFNKEKIQ